MTKSKMRSTDESRALVGQSQAQIHTRIIETIQSLPEMTGKTLLHLSIGGSRSKQLASDDSDYDVKAIVLSPADQYLLQKVPGSKSFATGFIHPETKQTVELEGTLIDYLKMQRYILSSNPAAYDSLFGISILESPESQYLRRLFQKAYDPHCLVLAYRGLLRHERKVTDKNHNQSGYIKHVANTVYYASMVQALSSGEGLPPHDAFELLERILMMKPALRAEIRDLYHQRKTDKSIANVDLEPFLAFIQQGDDQSLPDGRVTTKEKEALQVEADKEFLRLMHSEIK